MISFTQVALLDNAVYEIAIRTESLVEVLVHRHEQRFRHDLHSIRTGSLLTSESSL